MNQKQTVRYPVTAMALCVVSASVSPLAAAQTLVTDDYVAIIVEAEAYIDSDERWVLTEPGTPVQENDPDGNHSDGASGAAYLELLPDIRVTHDDPFGPPTAFWGPSGSGPTASYAVDFPEPGRYHVHVRAYSTGTEDNGIHIGLDGDWPRSGTILQLCTAGSRAWRWSSRQRYSGGDVCGIPKTIWLTVEEAGPATVMISAREDGFEIDQMMLIKDRSDNTRTCSPSFNNPSEVDCVDGGIETSDDFVDLAVTLESAAEESETAPGDSVEVIASLRNRDRFDTANAVRLSFDLDEDAWDVIASDERCEAVDGGVSCALEALGPSGSGPGEDFTLTLAPQLEGLLRIDATVTSEQSDDNIENDSALLDIEVESRIVPTALTVTLGDLPDEVELDERVALSLAVTNAGEAEALDTVLSLDLGDGLDVHTSPEACDVSSQRIVCTSDTLGVGETLSFPVSVLASALGTHAIEASSEASNAAIAEAASSLRVVVVEVPPTDSGGDVDEDRIPGDRDDGDADVDTAGDAVEDRDGDGDTGVDRGEGIGGDTGADGDGIVVGGRGEAGDGEAGDGETVDGAGDAVTDPVDKETASNLSERIGSGASALLALLALALIRFGRAYRPRRLD